MCIDRFTNVEVAVGGSDESLNLWIFKKEIRLNYTFWQRLGCKEAYNLKNLLSRVQPYINYEEKLLASGGNRGLGNFKTNQTSKKYFGRLREEHKQSLRPNFNT